MEQLSLLDEHSGKRQHEGRSVIFFFCLFVSPPEGVIGLGRGGACNLTPPPGERPLGHANRVCQHAKTIGQYP